MILQIKDLCLGNSRLLVWHACSLIDLCRCSFKYTVVVYVFIFQAKKCQVVISNFFTTYRFHSRWFSYLFPSFRFLFIKKKKFCWHCVNLSSDKCFNTNLCLVFLSTRIFIIQLISERLMILMMEVIRGLKPSDSLPTRSPSRVNLNQSRKPDRRHLSSVSV